MIGAIAGDIVGSVFEKSPIKTTTFPLFAETSRACIAGGIAQAYYGQIPADIIVQVRRRLPGALLRIIDSFNAAYAIAFKRFGWPFFWGGTSTMGFTLGDEICDAIV
jgi:hypothetical protein